MGAVTIPFAKAHLSRLIERAAAGEEIIILRGETPVARLTALPRGSSKRKFGAYRGEFEVPASFFEPLPEAELKAFESEGYGANPPGHARDDQRPAPVAKRRSRHSA